MTRRGDVFWDPSGPEFEPEELADTGSGGKQLGIPPESQPCRVPGLPLPANYEHRTDIINNQLEMLASILKGMRQ